MAYRLLVLGACCAGKTSLHDGLRDRLCAIESDDAVLERAGGTWPSAPSEIRRLVVEIASEALAMENVVYLSSFVPTPQIRKARADGFTVAVLQVPRDELERRNRERQRAGGHGDMSHWFESQLENYADLEAEHLIDLAIDGSQPLNNLVASVAALTDRIP